MFASGGIGRVISRSSAMFVLLAVTGMSLGGIIADDESEGYAAISGTNSFAAADWSAEVDYAVYGPGDYPGTHADKDDRYIYAYQVFNDSGSADALASFSVGLAGDAEAGVPGSDSSYGTLGGQAPALSQLIGSPATSVRWRFNLSASEYSEVLLFSSPNTYTFDNSTLMNGGEGDTLPIPSPVPAPTTFVLLGTGAVALLRRRLRN